MQNENSNQTKVAYRLAWARTYLKKYGVINNTSRGILVINSEFEKLTQVLLREAGFSQVEVTKKTGDGGIDGIGKFKINGIISFKLAFQCKRYNGQISTAEIRDFRGSMTTDVEKGIFITTGSFSRSALKEAKAAGKKHIDLIDGEQFIDKLKELNLDIKKEVIYVVDKDFFTNYKR